MREIITMILSLIGYGNIARALRAQKVRYVPGTTPSLEFKIIGLDADIQLSLIFRRDMSQNFTEMMSENGMVRPKSFHLFDSKEGEAMWGKTADGQGVSEEAKKEFTGFLEGLAARAEATREEEMWREASERKKQEKEPPKVIEGNFTDDPITE